MVKNLVVGMLNVRNRYKVKNYNGIDNGKDNILLLRDFLFNNEVNIL